jgi:hypothetical protein
MAKPQGPTGVYANYFQVGYTAFEMVIDFGENYDEKHPGCHTRIVTSPVYARALLETLSRALDGYRESYGEEDSSPRRPSKTDGVEP